MSKRKQKTVRRRKKTTRKRKKTTRKRKKITKKQINDTLLRDEKVSTLLKHAKDIERDIKKRTRKFNKYLKNVSQALTMFDLVEQRLDLLKSKTVETIDEACGHVKSKKAKKIPKKLQGELDAVQEILKKRDSK